MRTCTVATSGGRPPLPDVTRRVSLPVVDRRLVLRGLAATLAATLTGCRISLDHAESIEPDAGTVDPASDASPGRDAGPGFAQCGDKVCIDLQDPANAALRVVDGARIMTLGGKRMLVVRTAADTFVALSAICTHSGCSVRYAANRRDVECPCHGSTFAINGTVTHGPALTPLAVFAASYDPTTDVVSIAV